MSKYKRTLLHGLLFAVFAVLPVSAFESPEVFRSAEMKSQEHPEKSSHHVEKARARFRFGVYYGRPYRYRPHYYYYPYRPYYHRHYNYPYRPYRPYYYRW